MLFFIFFDASFKKADALLRKVHLLFLKAHPL